MQDLYDFLTSALEWLLDALLWVPRKTYELLLDGLATVIEALPVPAFLQGADPFASLDAGVVFFAEAFAIPQGIQIRLTAYGLRFLIRRIPIIG